MVNKVKGKRLRREWTKDQERELKGHSRAKTPVVKISKLMKRTEGALRQKALQLAAIARTRLGWRVEASRS